MEISVSTRTNLTLRKYRTTATTDRPHRRPDAFLAGAPLPRRREPHHDPGRLLSGSLARGDDRATLARTRRG
jgi:hypothetical protein